MSVRNCVILLQGYKWLPKTGGSRNAPSCRCQAAPSILQKSGGPCPPASYAPVMPYLCSRFYADIKFYISIKLTTYILHKSVTYHVTLLKFHTSPWDFFQQDQLWLKNQCIHRQLFPQCQNCQNQASIDKFLEKIIKHLDIVIPSAPVVPFYPALQHSSLEFQQTKNKSGQLLEFINVKQKEWGGLPLRISIRQRTKRESASKVHNIQNLK